MPARMGTNHLLVCPAKAKKAIFTTTYCKHGQRRAGKFCFHFDGDSIIILVTCCAMDSRRGLATNLWRFMEIYRICRMAKRRRDNERERLLRNTVNNETSIRRNNRIEDAPLSCREKRRRRGRKLNAIHSRHKRA
jgi:hypothetical protein